MGLGRTWRRRRKKPTIDQQLAAVTDSLEALANEIFLFALTTDQAMPPRSAVESAVKTVMMDFLEPARQLAIQAGKPVGEVEAYADVVTSHAQVAFQNKWAELEQRRAEQAPSCSGEVAH